MTAAKKKRAAKRKPGRPTIYSDERAAAICTRLAEGESLRTICAKDDMPDKATVLRWLLDGEHDWFLEQYARAREAQADHLADEILDIADDGRNDWTKNETGKSLVDHEHVARSRLRVDTRRWLMARMAPKKYGDRLQHTGDGGGPIRVAPDLSKLTEEDLDALERILGRASDAG